MVFSKGAIFGHFWEESVMTWHLRMEAHLHIKIFNNKYGNLYLMRRKRDIYYNAGNFGRMSSW